MSEEDLYLDVPIPRIPVEVRLMAMLEYVIEHSDTRPDEQWRAVRWLAQKYSDGEAE